MCRVRVKTNDDGSPSGLPTNRSLLASHPSHSLCPKIQTSHELSSQNSSAYNTEPKSLSPPHDILNLSIESKTSVKGSQSNSFLHQLLTHLLTNTYAHGAIR